MEDKIPIANELCDRLERTGARIWYCGRELNAGDSIKKTIQEGLSKSRYGIIILSKSFLSKSWNPTEFLTFITSEYYASKKNILLLFYNVTKEDLPYGIPEQTERFAYHIGKELDDVIQFLIAEINSSLSATLNKRRQKFSFLRQC